MTGNDKAPVERGLLGFGVGCSEGTGQPQTNTGRVGYLKGAAPVRPGARLSATARWVSGGGRVSWPCSGTGRCQARPTHTKGKLMSQTPNPTPDQNDPNTGDTENDK